MLIYQYSFKMNGNMLRQGYLFLTLLLILMLLHPSCLLALNRNDAFWLALNKQSSIPNSPWNFYFYAQSRFISQQHTWQSILIEGALGQFIYAKQVSFWCGYRWTIHQPFSDPFQSDRLFQQLLLNNGEQPIQLIGRIRLEQIKPSNRSQVVIHLRLRGTMEFRNWQQGRFVPVIYNELFLPLKTTSYTSSQFINENRLFLGFNYLLPESARWEIGYINQFQFKRPQEKQNNLTNIFTITYNF